jgi:hypothetical protein
MLTLTGAGRALRERARGVPQCVATAVGKPRAEIEDLRDRLLALRTQMFQHGG